MRLSDDSSVTMSLCLTGVECAPSTPNSTVIATTNGTRRLTGTAYDPTLGNAGVDEIVLNALHNRRIVVGRSRIRLCTIGQPARAVTVFAGTCRGPCRGDSLLCAGSSSSECGSATGRCRSLTILRIQILAGSSTNWYS